MAVSANLLTTGGSSSAVTSISTASVTPGANRLVAIYIVTDSGAPTSVTGNGLTWVQEILNTTLVPIAMWRSMGASPSAGQITINLAANSVISWVVVEYDGVDTSGTNGSGAIRASQDTSGTASGVTSQTLTLPGAVNAGNAVAAMFIHGALEAQTPGTGYATLGETTASGFVDQSHIWRADGTTTPSVSWATSANSAGLAVEIVAATTATGPDPNQWLGAVFPATRGPVPATPSRFLQPWWDPSPPSAVEAHSGAATDADRTSGTTAGVHDGIGAGVGQQRSASTAAGTKSAAGATQSGTRTSGVSLGIKGATGPSSGGQRTVGTIAAVKQAARTTVGGQRNTSTGTAIKAAQGTAAGQQRITGLVVRQAPFSVGQLTATDSLAGTLAGTDTAAALTATGSSGLLTATDTGTDTLTTREQAGGPT